MTSTRNPWCDDIPWSFKSPPTYETLAASDRLTTQTTLLHLNESPLAPSSVVAAAASDAVGTLNRYPDNHYHRLTEAIALDTGIEPSRQAWGAGASDLIYRCVALTTREGGHIVSPSPTFWGYERVFALAAANVSRVPLADDGQLDVDAMIAAITPATTLVTFTTPANPSGMAISRNNFDKLVAAIPAGALFLVDEVYFEFARHDGEFDMLEALHNQCSAPWLVLRSFSKAWRLAGARVGYGLASSPMIADRVQNHAVNFAVSSLTFEVAYASYCNSEAMHDYLQFNQTQRNAMIQRLLEAGLRVLPSSANFISVELPVQAAQINPQLVARDIYCGQWHHESFANYLRVGVGTEAEVDRMTRTLLELLDVA